MARFSLRDGWPWSKGEGGRHGPAGSSWFPGIDEAGVTRDRSASGTRAWGPALLRGSSWMGIENEGSGTGDQGEGGSIMGREASRGIWMVKATPLPTSLSQRMVPPKLWVTRL